MGHVKLFMDVKDDYDTSNKCEFWRRQAGKKDLLHYSKIPGSLFLK